jgi:radical SAM protein with 4Fe4S-binding SPASM domain
MGPEEFARILEAFPTAKKVELQGIGEVFLNDRVFEVIAEAVQRGVAVHTFSNGSLITPQLATRIVESGLQLINFSLDGADEATFRRLRKGGTLARFKRSVRNLLAAKRSLGAEFPTVNLMCVLQQDNLPQVPRMLAIAEELGVENAILTKINAGTRDGLDPKLLTDADREALLGMAEYDGKVNPVWAVTPWTTEERMGCYWPRSMAYVTVEGNVTPCCNYYDEREMNLGNVFEQSGEEVWNSDAYRAFRRKLWNGQLPSKCETC